jgi:hypothetical protein
MSRRNKEKIQMTALFMVRAQIADEGMKRAFDRWYQEEHLPDALQAFRAQRAWRGWSDADPLVHYAWYEFADLASARAILGSEALKRLVADFDHAWGNKVARSRDFVTIVQAENR